MGYAKEKYDLMIKEISEHKDFGKRNPVDIGVECGYSEKVVLEMLKKLSEKAEDKEKNNNLEAEQKEKGGLKRKKRLYYFFIRKDKKGKYIVSVNRDNWKVEIIEKIKGYDDNWDKYDIRGNIFVRTRGGYNNQKTLLWENVETKETKKLLTDKEIDGLMILKEGVLVLTPDELLIWDGEKITARKENTEVSFYKPSIFETDGRIYIAEDSYIYTIDSKLCGKLKRHEVIKPSTSGLVTEPYQLQELGVDEGKIFGYGSYERYGSGFFNTNKYYVDSVLELNTRIEKQFPFCRDIRNHRSSFSVLFRDFTTKNYGLLGTEIYSRKQMLSDDWSVEPVCIFERCLPRKQVIAEYDKDTFIALDENDDIIKIDMRNEREPVVIPVFEEEN